LWRRTRRLHWMPRWTSHWLREVIFMISEVLGHSILHKDIDSQKLGKFFLFGSFLIIWLFVMTWHLAILFIETFQQLIVNILLIHSFGLTNFF
jgi:hypothetical protein